MTERVLATIRRRKIFRLAKRELLLPMTVGTGQMIVIGVDPGSIATGYGVIRKIAARSEHVASGVVRASSGASQPKRLWQIYEKLDGIVREYRPEVMVVESLFHATNTQSLMKLSQVRGAILLLGESHGMEIFEYSPMEIKKGLTGYGRAEKDQIIYMVSKILGLTNVTSPDQADALAMALYHSHVCLPDRVAS
jgi:crossover junction endodeoxyribonuclease RuvC